MTIRRRACLAALATAMAFIAAACSGGSSAPTTPAVKSLLTKASSEIKTKQFASAGKDLATVIEKQPYNVDALYDRALLAQLQGRPNVALAGYNLVIHERPTYLPALFNSALLYTRGAPLHAISLYRQIIQLRPHAPSAYLNLGLLEYKLGRHAQAAADLQVALQQQPVLRSHLSSAQRRLVASAKGAHKPTSKP